MFESVKNSIIDYQRKQDSSRAWMKEHQLWVERTLGADPPSDVVTQETPPDLFNALQAAITNANMSETSKNLLRAYYFWEEAGFSEQPTIESLAQQLGMRLSNARMALMRSRKTLAQDPTLRAFFFDEEPQHSR